LEVLVTGGAGFIGANLARALLESGDRVRTLDDLSTGSLGNLAGVESQIDLVVGDVRNGETVDRAARGVEVIYHLAALPSVARSVRDPATVDEVNVRGTLNVLLAGRDQAVRRVVYASSSSVYGDTPALPKDEEMRAVPLSPYAASKLAGEAYCQAFTHVFGLETVSLRFFNVFGPRQDPGSEYAAVIPAFLRRMLAGDRPEVHGDGLQTRDFTFVGNAVEACLRGATAGPEAAGEVMNVGCGSRITVLELVRGLNAVLGTALEPIFTAPRPGDVRDSLASIEKAERLIGYRPRVSVWEGLGQTARWFARASQPARMGE
jgi:UDP-glucose 4-epimerase